jgi:hypothetical protein
VSRRENYRQKALECAEAADGASDPAERLALLEIAQAWLRLSDHLPGELEPQLPLQEPSRPAGADGHRPGSER